MELRDEQHAFSELLGRPVVDQAGRSLGRVFEARARWEPDGTIVIEELMIGRRALFRRMRGPGPDVRGIPWQAVREIAADRIVVLG